MPEEFRSVDSAVAVIGMGCRFPQADGIDELWQNMLDNTDSITPVPPDRFDAGRFYDPVPRTPGKTVSRHGGFLADAFGFDAAFFGIAPVEAKTMDPQQRLLLHVVWEALEDAGIVPSSLAGSRTGVFVGQATAEYGEAHATADVHGAAGSRIRGVTAGRLSYCLDLRGPSLVLDTACSSSLVAVHSARQSLLTGESDLAVVGGANLVLTPDDAIAYSQGGMLAPGGRCRFGDADGDGFVRSDGIGAVILKRLGDAVKDNDPVLGVIRGSAVTHEGQGDGLLLRPSVAGQRAMLREALRSAGIGADRLDYVEAHGTGTTVGDAVELRALIEERARHGAAAGPLRVGSVKSNIGHAEAAAGMAGLIKALLVLRHRTIPATLHVTRPNPQVAASAGAVRLVTENEPLAPAGDAALIGISSFGIGGTNAHVVLGEYVPEPRPATAPRPAPAGPELLVLSARSADSLRRTALSYAAFLRPGGKGHGTPLDAICAAAATRREAHPHRLWAVGDTHADLADRLERLARGEEPAGAGTGKAPSGPAKRTVFVFPGQGSQWAGMGRGLLAASPAFRAALEECDRAVREELGWSVRELLEAPAESFPAEVEVVQPVLWAMEIALAAAWAERGVTPDVCVGHSMGETAAAHVAGALTLADAAAVICRRSRLMRRLVGRGSMLAVELGAEQAAEAVAPYGDRVCVAAENAPTATVLSGDSAVLDAVARELDARGVLARRVKVNVASHSPLTDELRADLVDALAALDPTPVSRTMVSTVTGGPVDGSELDGPYWARNLRDKVRFTEAVGAAGSADDSVFVEVSPHPLLTHGVEETLGAAGTAVESLRRDQDEATALARSVGRLFAAGGRVDWERYHGGVPEAVALPGYPWQSIALRLAPREDAATAAAPVHVRETSLADRTDPAAWGEAISVHGFAPVPPMVYADALLGAAHELRPGAAWSLHRVRLGGTPVEASDADLVRLRLTMRPDQAGWRCTVHALHPRFAEPVLCMTADVREGGAAELRQGGDAVLDRALASCRRYVSQARFEEHLARLGFAVDAPFLAVERSWSRDGMTLSRMRRPQVATPAGWESVLLPLLAALPAARFGARHTYAAVGFDSVELAAELPERFWSLATTGAASGAPVAAGASGASVRGHVLVLGDDGRVVARIKGVTLRRSALGGPTGLDRIPALAAQVRERLTGGRRRTPEQSAPAAAPDQPAYDRPVHGDPAHGDQGAVAPAGVDLPALAASVLGMDSHEVDLDRSLRDQGLDSLMASRLRQHLASRHDLRVSVSRLLGEESAGALTREFAQVGGQE